MNNLTYHVAHLHLLQTMSSDTKSLRSFDTSELRDVFVRFTDALVDAGERQLDIDNYFVGNHVQTILEAGKLLSVLEFVESGEASPSVVRDAIAEFMAKHCNDVKWMLMYYRPLKL